MTDIPYLKCLVLRFWIRGSRVPCFCSPKQTFLAISGAKIIVVAEYRYQLLDVFRIALQGHFMECPSSATRMGCILASAQRPLTRCHSLLAHKFYSLHQNSKNPQSMKNLQQTNLCAREEMPIYIYLYVLQSTLHV